MNNICFTTVLFNIKGYGCGLPAVFLDICIAPYDLLNYFYYFTFLLIIMIMANASAL